jgi:hypothetical protein
MPNSTSRAWARASSFRTEGGQSHGRQVLGAPTGNFGARSARATGDFGTAFAGTPPERFPERRASASVLPAQGGRGLN